MTDDVLDRLSFLRTSDTSSQDKSYHFYILLFRNFSLLNISSGVGDLDPANQFSVSSTTILREKIQYHQKNFSKKKSTVDAMMCSGGLSQDCCIILMKIM
jgi:transcriptional regulator GlxA family with amidase domain